MHVALGVMYYCIWPHVHEVSTDAKRCLILCGIALLYQDKLSVESILGRDMYVCAYELSFLGHFHLYSLRKIAGLIFGIILLDSVDASKLCFLRLHLLKYVKTEQDSWSFRDY